MLRKVREKKNRHITMNSNTGTPTSTAPVALSVADFSTALATKNEPQLAVYKKVMKTANSKMRRQKKASLKPQTPNKWNAHVKAFRLEHPEVNFKESLQQAKLTYKK